MSILKQSYDKDQEEDETNLNNGPDFIQIIFKGMVYYSFACNMYINQFFYCTTFFRCFILFNKSFHHRQVNLKTRVPTSNA
jgi:hypothetical protein